MVIIIQKNSVRRILSVILFQPDNLILLKRFKHSTIEFDRSHFDCLFPMF